MPAVTSALRTLARRCGVSAARRLARRHGLQIVEGVRGTEAPDGFELIPTDRSEPFETAGYQVLPKGRFDVVPRDFYSPVPDLAALPDDIFDRRSALGGIALNLDGAIAFAEAELAPFVAELDVPAHGPRPPGTFYLRNANYESVDAELLYAMVRWTKPRRVIELGSGFTTLLIGMAVERNAAEGIVTEHVAYDPYPREAILGGTPHAERVLRPVSATDVPLETFRALRAGDVLFVDTTHTVKLGSDVNFIILDVLPVLAPGVIVHFHDIFLPWEYPRVWFEEMGYLWAEQYLLQAFLAYNSAFEVLLPAQALAREHPQRLAGIVPSFGPGCSPGAFWIRRR